MEKATLIRQEHIKKLTYSPSHKTKINERIKRGTKKEENYSLNLSCPLLPPLCPHVCSLSVLPLLPCKEFHQYHFSRFHIYALIMIFGFLFLTYFALCNRFQLHPLIKSITMVFSGKVENNQHEEQSKQKFHFIQTVLTFSLFFTKL